MSGGNAIFKFNKKYCLCFFAVLIILYCTGIIYFKFHFYLGTKANNINISGYSLNGAVNKSNRKIKDYSLTIKEKDKQSEKIYGRDIGVNIDSSRVFNRILYNQNSNNWFYETLKSNYYEDDNLIQFDENAFKNAVDNLKCLNENVQNPQNAKILFNNGIYNIVPEVQGNKINKDKFYELLIKDIKSGKRTIDLEKEKCYEKPKYTWNSMEVVHALDICRKYCEAEVQYDFEGEKEIVDRAVISKFINIDNDFYVTLDKDKVKEYVKDLSRKYDTFAIDREFAASTGRTVTVKGGNYGFKINKYEEINELIKNIEKGNKCTREPVYTQKALGRGENDIGDTYVEINLTRQHLWFYKEGKIIVQGDVVTGNPSKGCSTPSGVYGLNYKQKDAVLNGAGYSSDVKFWMPFNGNIGLHDASWRYSFGGNIYKNNGTHGCVNMPYYMAKKIYNNIEENTPIICYKEEE